MIRFFSFCIVSVLLFFALILLNSTSCSNVNSPSGSFVVNKGGKIVKGSDGNTANKDQEFKEELNVVVNDFFTVDKKKKELVYKFNPNAWFCAKRSVTNIQRHAVGFPIDLALDGDEYFAAVFLGTSSISLAPYQEKIAISKIFNGIYPTNISRVLPAANFTWSDISIEFSNQTVFWNEIIKRSIMRYGVSDVIHVDEYPVLAFLPHASEPGMLVHFYVYDKSYKFKVGDVERIVVNPYTTAFVEIVPALIYHNGALDSDGVEILLSLGLYVEDFSSAVKFNLTKKKLVKLMVSGMDGKFFDNNTRQRRGHEYPLTIKIVFPKHAGRTGALVCN